MTQELIEEEIANEIAEVVFDKGEFFFVGDIYEDWMEDPKYQGWHADAHVEVRVVSKGDWYTPDECRAFGEVELTSPSGSVYLIDVCGEDYEVTRKR